MKSRWLIAVLTLPIPVAVLIPAALIFAFRASRWTHSFSTPSSHTFWFGATAGLLGLTLAAWSVLTFARHGEGTPAPWDPPTRFVARGPYCFVRNPMILGVFLLLFAEATLLRSLPLLAWFAVFIAGNSFYIPLIEEKGLEQRYGTTYAKYRECVSRWIPRRTAWHSQDGNMREVTTLDSHQSPRE